MDVKGVPYRTIWLEGSELKIIDQRKLPHEFVVKNLENIEQVVTAIKDMQVRGAGLIGATVGYGMYLGALDAPAEGSDEYMKMIGERLKSTRPTAVNLEWAVNKQLAEISKGKNLQEKIRNAFNMAVKIANEDEGACRQIGLNGLDLVDEISKEKEGKPVNIMTHCNAGWLAFVNYGSALSPIYAAHDLGIPVHVWVSETRPRNQGSKLTAWELENQGVPYTIIADNAAGHLMRQGKVDLCVVGADRVTSAGDVVNKIGTYLKALAANDNGVPFYVAFPSSTLDWKTKNGKDIIIEERGSDEIKYAEGRGKNGTEKVLLAPEKSKAVNFGFDVTPARYITGFITERGICKPNEEDIRDLLYKK